jgi:hypothetical protein
MRCVFRRSVAAMTQSLFRQRLFSNIVCGLHVGQQTSSPHVGNRTGIRSYKEDRHG